MKKIDFTVLIPVFNTKPSELIECVYSLHHSNQTIDQEYDIVIVDDASTSEGTLKALEFLKSSLGIIVLTMAENGGTSKALNAGHEFIKTEWIALSGSSDISFKNRFKLQVEHLQENPNIDVLGTNLFSFEDSDPFRKPTFTSKHGYTRTLIDSSYGWLTNHGTTFCKNQSVKDVGGYKLPGRAQDVELWVRMFKAGKKIHTLAPVLYGWRRDKK
jgi:glycosyltransferase EpsE